MQRTCWIMPMFLIAIEVWWLQSNTMLAWHVKVTALAISLKCYSQILCGGSAEKFRFWLFYIDLVANWCENKKYWSRVAPVYLDRTANYLIIIIGSDNIFNIEVNGANGASAIQVIMYNSLTQNWNRLKFWINLMLISIYWWHRKMMLKSGNRPFCSEDTFYFPP